MDVSGDAFVLFGNPLFRIDHHQNHVGALYAAQRINNTVFFKLFGGFPPAPDTGRIDQKIRFLVAHEERINGITGCSRGRIGYHPFKTQQTVDQRGLAHIWASNHGDLGQFIIRFARVRRREHIHKVFYQVHHATVMFRGDGIERFNTKGVEFGRFVLEPVTVHLIDNVKHRLFDLSKHLCHLDVCRGKSAAGIHHEKDHIRLVHGQA